MTFVSPEIPDQGVTRISVTGFGTGAGFGSLPFMQWLTQIFMDKGEGEILYLTEVVALVKENGRIVGVKALDPNKKEIYAPVSGIDGFKKGIELGGIKVADTLNELAEQLGLDPAKLNKAVSDWNTQCASGTVSEWNYPLSVLHKQMVIYTISV